MVNSGDDGILSSTSPLPGERKIIEVVAELVMWDAMLKGRKLFNFQRLLLHLPTYSSLPHPFI